MTNTNFLWTATHQTANGGRETQAFDNPGDYLIFCRENERYLTSTSEPTRTQIERYAAWVKRNINNLRPGLNGHDLLVDLRNVWRKAPR